MFLPRLSRCYFCLANPLELRLLAKKLLEGSMRRLALSKKRNLDEDPFDRIADNPASKLDYAIVDNSRQRSKFYIFHCYYVRLSTVGTFILFLGMNLSASIWCSIAAWAIDPTNPRRPLWTFPSRGCWCCRGIPCCIGLGTGATGTTTSSMQSAVRWLRSL